MPTQKFLKISITFAALNRPIILLLFWGDNVRARTIGLTGPQDINKEAATPGALADRVSTYTYGGSMSRPTNLRCVCAEKSPNQSHSDWNQSSARRSLAHPSSTDFLLKNMNTKNIWLLRKLNLGIEGHDDKIGVYFLKISVFQLIMSMSINNTHNVMESFMHH